MEYTYGILFITLLITIGADIYVKSTYKKTKKIESKRDINGFTTARKILDSNGLDYVQINEIPVELSDHYDPRSKTVTISTDVYRLSNIASISVAAHECGHAIQDKERYFFLRLRSRMVPVVNLATSLGYVAILIGAFSQLLTKLLWVGIFLEAIILAFQLITLPVEFDASKRALQFIKKYDLVTDGEYKQCKKMLTAAALTYVASVATYVLEIIRLVIFARRDD